MNACNLFRASMCVITLGAGLDLSACGAFKSDVKLDVPSAERPRVAMLPFDMGIEITSLASIRNVNGELKPDEEPRLIKQAVKQVREDARRLMYERLTGKKAFDLIPLERTDRELDGLGITTTERLTPEQLAKLRARLNVDLVVTGVVQDYGKVRWQWLAAGMAGDMTWESIVIGLATSWNPVIILGNVGFELLTSTPVWFGGGYLFGVAFRPVRVEAWAVDLLSGESIWTETEVAIYAKGRLKELPEAERDKKEAQLGLNLKRAMEALADSFLEENITKTTLWERRLPAQEVEAF